MGNRGRFQFAQKPRGQEQRRGESKDDGSVSFLDQHARAQGAILFFLKVKELYLNGRKYTWSNERQRPTLEKINHIFTSNCWEDLHPACLLTALGSAISYHCPLLLDLNADFRMGKRFRFEVYWPKADEFFDTVEAAWHSVPRLGLGVGRRKKGGRGHGRTHGSLS